jgi:hypothetical protein
MNSTPYSSSIGSAAIACFAVQPVFASTRTTFVGRLLADHRRISSSRGVPTLIFRIG